MYSDDNSTTFSNDIESPTDFCKFGRPDRSQFPESISVHFSNQDLVFERAVCVRFDLHIFGLRELASPNFSLFVAFNNLEDLRTVGGKQHRFKTSSILRAFDVIGSGISKLERKKTSANVLRRI